MAFPTVTVTPGSGQTVNTLPNAGQQLMAGSLPVVLASDQSPLSVIGQFYQATQPISIASSVAVTGTFWPATQPISGAVSVGNFPASQAVTGTFWQATQPISGSVSVSNFPATQPVTGTFWQATQPVSLVSVPSHPVTNAGTFAVQAAGDVAAGSADSGNPQKIGGLAKTANPAAVTDGQRVNALWDKLGKQVVVHSLRELRKVQQTAITSSTAETTIIIAGAAGVFNDLYGLTISNSSATVATVTIKDATAGTTRGVFTIPATQTVACLHLPASDGIPQASAATNWTATSSASVASLQITALYVQST